MACDFDQIFESVCGLYFVFSLGESDLYLRILAIKMTGGFSWYMIFIEVWCLSSLSSGKVHLAFRDSLKCAGSVHLGKMGNVFVTFDSTLPPCSWRFIYELST